MTDRLIIASLCILATACVTSRRRDAACDLSTSDSAFAGGFPVYRACSVDRPARLIGVGGQLNFSTPTRPPECISADLTFVVDEAGKPEISTARLERGRDREFGEALLATLDSWTYEPAIRDGKPVRQIVNAHQTASTAPAQPGGAPPRPPVTQPRC
jgi:hypothetical protein